VKVHGISRPPWTRGDCLRRPVTSAVRRRRPVTSARLHPHKLPQGISAS